MLEDGSFACGRVRPSVFFCHPAGEVSLLCDMAFISEYLENDRLMVYLVRRQITDPSIQDLRHAAEAIRQCDRLQLWAVLSRGVHMRVTLPSGTARVSPEVLAIQADCRAKPVLPP